MGVSLEKALEAVAEFGSGYVVDVDAPRPATTNGELSESALIAQNEAALRQLQQMMPGLGV